jgi:hypothetical protein
LAESNRLYAGLFGYTVSDITIKNVGVNIHPNGITSTLINNTHGSSFAGGLISNSSSATIANCYVTGDITAITTNDLNFSYVYAGGLVGNSENVTIENCYTMCNIVAIATSGWAYAGGLVSKSIQTSIVNSYATGDVIAGSTVSYAGGLIGNSSIVDIKSCYRLNNQTIIGDITNEIGMPLTHEEMQNRDLFVGWNFQTIWNSNSNINRGYPYLTIRDFVHPIITISVQPENKNVTQGKIEGNLTIEAYITSNQTLDYQWYQCLNTIPDLSIDDLVGTGDSFAIPLELTAGTYDYYCVVSGAADTKNVISNIATVTVNAPLVITPVSVTLSAFITQFNGNKNDLTITVTEHFSDGSINVITKTFAINNNATGTYQVNNYNIYVDTKGNTQIRACYIAE